MDKMNTTNNNDLIKLPTDEQWLTYLGLIRGNQALALNPDFSTEDNKFSNMMERGWVILKTQKVFDAFIYMNGDTGTSTQKIHQLCYRLSVCRVQLINNRGRKQWFNNFISITDEDYFGRGRATLSKEVVFGLLEQSISSTKDDVNMAIVHIRRDEKEDLTPPPTPKPIVDADGFEMD
jgi:hypothetical protein